MEVYVKKEFDVYELILNREIKEYFRKNRKFTIPEQIQLILHSYASAENKLENLYRLAESVGEVERKSVAEIAEAMKYCMERAHDQSGNLGFEVETEWINGKQEVIGFYPERDFFQKNGFSNTVYNAFVDYGIRHIKLPFEDGCRVKIQTPAMEEAVYGVVYAEEDENGCWYYFVRKDNCEDKDKLIDISYHEIDVASGYNVFDWVEKVE